MPSSEAPTAGGRIPKPSTLNPALRTCKRRALWDKGGPDGWRKDSQSEVKLDPEFTTPHTRGSIAMRRFRNPDSAGSQFIITLAGYERRPLDESVWWGEHVVLFVRRILAESRDTCDTPVPQASILSCRSCRHQKRDGRPDECP
jgi:hypothetical protein